MKPAYDQLGDEYADSSSVLIGDADCTASGKELCNDNDVRGYPTIKYFNGETGPKGADYSGGRDFDSLKKFVEDNLEVKCLLIELNKGVSFVNLDDVLVDLKLAPEVLEVPVPKYFIEDQARALEEREKLLDVLQLQAGIDPKKGKAQARDDSMTLGALRPPSPEA